MKIAIVILNWNGVSLLNQFLPKVIQYSQDAQVYVADNASTDGSVVFLKKYFPQIKIIENSENGGYAKGYNQALSQIEADVYCLLNSDVEVTENWLNPIVECFSKDNEIAIVQPKILDHKNRIRFEYAGAAGGFLDKYGFPFCRGRIFDTIEMDLGQYDNNIDLFWASGACFFIRSEVFRKIQGFDEDFFAHQEEIDLCWRVHHLKKRIIYCSDTVVYHVGGATLSVGNPKKVYLNFRNGLFMLIKNLPKRNCFGRIFIRMIFDGIAGVRFLLQGKFTFTWAIVKAHFSFYQKARYFYKKRKRISYKNYYMVNSIVWEYFLRNRKVFSSLKFINKK